MRFSRRFRVSLLLASLTIYTPTVAAPILDGLIAPPPRIVSAAPIEIQPHTARPAATRWWLRPRTSIIPQEDLTPAPETLAPATPILHRWAHDDATIARGERSGTWTWGPSIFRGLHEAYAEAPDAARGVWYFDKARMEITHPDADAVSEWYVTSGLLVRELISGSIQTGDSAAEQRDAADVPVAGDLEAPLDTTISYRDLQPLASLNSDQRVERRGDDMLIDTIGKGGAITPDERFAQYEVRIGGYDDVLGHNIADVFADALPADRLLYIAGRPLTEPYWAIVPVAGESRDVLIQAFERRVLTYTPSNPGNWRVEWGNVGRQYAQWRYGLADGGAAIDPLPLLDPAPAIHELAELSPDAARIVAAHDGAVTAAVLDLRSGDIYSINGTRPYTMFSTVKVSVMIGVLERARREGRDLADWEDSLMRSMIQRSDNEATSVLLESIGGAGRLEAYLRGIGVENTRVDRDSWGLSTTTSQDMVRLLAKLADCSILDEQRCRYALALMRGVVPDQAWGIGAGVPDGVAVALKNGWSPDDDGYTTNSIGYVEGTPRYTIAVYARGNRSKASGIDTIEQIARAIAGALNPPPAPAAAPIDALPLDPPPAAPRTPHD